MADPRVDQLARILVEYCTRIQPGDRVIIEAEIAAEPLIQALQNRILDAGGYPEQLLMLPDQKADFVRRANQVQLDFTPSLQRYAYEQFEARIRIHSESNTMSMSNIDHARVARWRAAREPILATQMARGARGELRWVTTLFPTQGYAQQAEMSLPEYEDFVFRACHVDDPAMDAVQHWLDVKQKQAGIVAALEGHDAVQVRGENCDLRLSVKGRAFMNSHGRFNMPDGEVYTGPVEESVEGWVRFTYPAIWQGRSVEGLELRFEGGKVTTATAQKGQDFLLQTLNTDAGARYLGEFAIGMNYGIDRFTGNILFDEKIGGTFHIALGSGYPETGSKNKSAIHWDLIHDLGEEGQIWLDGDLIYTSGRFRI
jgi:aminopeptidase